jgi:hypothetical protein
MPQNLTSRGVTSQIILGGGWKGHKKTWELVTVIEEVVKLATVGRLVSTSP